VFGVAPVALVEERPKMDIGAPRKYLGLEERLGES